MNNEIAMLLFNLEEMIDSDIAPSRDDLATALVSTSMINAIAGKFPESIELNQVACKLTKLTYKLQDKVKASRS